MALENGDPGKLPTSEHPMQKEVTTKRLGDLPEQERVERLQKLLGGRAQTNNPFVAYCLDELRTTLAQIKQLSDQLQQHQAVAKQAEEQIKQLVGQRSSLTKTLERWDEIPAEAQS